MSEKVVTTMSDRGTVERERERESMSAHTR